MEWLQNQTKGPDKDFSSLQGNLPFQAEEAVLLQENKQ